MPLDFSKVPQPNMLLTKAELLLDVTQGSIWRLKHGYCSGGTWRFKGWLALVVEARDYPGWYLCDITDPNGENVTHLVLPIGWEWFRRDIRLRKEGAGEPSAQPKAAPLNWRTLARLTVQQRKQWEEV